MFNFTKKIKKKFLSNNFGFSIIEMVVVVAIITLITSLILINHTVFNGGVILESLAYEIALTTRQAQFFSINVLQTGAVGSETFEAPYGVYFSSESDEGQNKQFVMFADIQENGKYGKSTADIIIESYNITRGNKIKSLCVDGNCDIEELFLSFKRPDPDALIQTDSPSDCNQGCSVAKIHVGSDNPKVKDKIITVTSTGQISIGND